MSGPERIDKTEHKRAEQLSKSARQRPSLHFSESERHSQAYTLPRRIMGYSTPAALGDALRREILKREYAKAHHADGLVVHVRNGKPLTAKGAALLGVPWDGEKTKEN